MPEEINIDKIQTDGGTQPRAELDEEVIEEYAEQMKNGDRFPALLVYNDGENYWLTDGFHRYHAHKWAGAELVRCRIKQGTRREAVLESVGVNAKHGLRRTNADKRRAATKLLEDEEWGKWSNYEIARQCNVSEPFIRGLRKTNHQTFGGENEERTYIDKHGTETTMNISKMGGNKQPQPTTDEESKPTPEDTDPEEEEPPTSKEKPIEEWSKSERERREKVEKQGQTVVANMHKDEDLVRWAKQNGYYVRIDRMTKWGNPFEIPGDGNRETVCDSYEVYFDLKYSLHKALHEEGELTNKVLGCHCYPERCHGNLLAKEANNED